ncbi:TPA: hypothetical protein ACTXAV_000956 [Raoultella planticola]|jgi:hypothetical protein|uniref:hypothetical protein n=1 Tax=Raoultella planticola TaxID=575 RepID=UPI000AE0D89D|nr:hypothetical protein [Raoultella planticola]ELU0691218.1 hypothetical protein [Raoultella planticola]ELU1430636.1 hypothetical protein [Raoultella planticola]HED2415217.1 hypothetical protein [Raoultella planticola]HED2621215.1 hypothetical protein [Raoultella planticola]HEH6361829.1 hypothetical protein [Raoultella planticola]
MWQKLTEHHHSLWLMNFKVISGRKYPAKRAFQWFGYLRFEEEFGFDRLQNGDELVLS